MTHIYRVRDSYRDRQRETERVRAELLHIYSIQREFVTLIEREREREREFVLICCIYIHRVCDAYRDREREREREFVLGCCTCTAKVFEFVTKGL